MEKGDFDTGNSTWSSARKLLWPKSDSSSDHSTLSLPEVPPPETTSGRKKQAFPTRNSSLAAYRSVVESQQIGISSGLLPPMETWSWFPQTYMYAATISCAVFARTIYAQLEWSEFVMFSGAGLVLESREMLGQPPVWTVTLKIPTANSGTGIEAIKTWSLMNFEVELQSTIFCAGSIDTHVSLRSKDPVCHCALETCGSRQT